MNLHQMARGLINRINPDVDVIVHPYLSYIINAAGDAAPEYGAPIGLKAQMQPAPTDLIQALGLEEGDIVKVFYFSGDYQALSRSRGKGGDLIFVGTDKYKTTGNDELWHETAGWNKVTGVLQHD